MKLLDNEQARQVRYVYYLRGKAFLNKHLCFEKLYIYICSKNL